MNNGGYGAGIGGNEGTYNGSGGDCGMVTVSSGNVTANGSSDGAGIGGGAGGTGGGKGGTVTISGGTVIATGSNGAGIGGGNCLHGVDDTYGGGGGKGFIKVTIRSIPSRQMTGTRSRTFWWTALPSVP